MVRAVPPADAARRPRRLRRWAPAIAFAIAYLYSFPHFPAIHSANELPRAYLVMAIVDEGRFVIDTGVARWGTTVDVSPSGGHHYSNKAPGSSLLAAPAYGILHAVTAVVAGRAPTLAETLWVCRVAAGVVPTLLFLWLLWGFLARWAPTRSARRLVILAYGLGSMAMTYSILFIAHQLSAVVIATAWIVAVRVLDRELGERWMLAAGALAGAAPLVDYQAAFAAVPIAIWVIARLVRDHRRDRRRALRIVGWAALGAAAPIALLLWYHAVCFGHPLRTGYAASETFAHFHQKGFLGMDRLRAEAFWGSTFAPDNGLFLFCPVLLAALPGWWLMWRRPDQRGHAATTLAIAVIYLLFISSLNFWRGGWQLGPRYITVMLPFWLPALASTVTWAHSRPIARTIVVGLAGVGVVVYAVSNALYPHFPERFANPLYEVTFSLLIDGHAPWNAGWLIGLRGTLSLLPYFIVVAALWEWAALPRKHLWPSALAGTALGLAIVLAYGALPRGDRTGDDAAYARSVAGAMPRP
jgi:hypothetical protein